jgi:hypothetical protein
MTVFNLSSRIFDRHRAETRPAAMGSGVGDCSAESSGVTMLAICL